jgi:hypothetical protein
VEVLKVEPTLLKSDTSSQDRDIYRLNINVIFLLIMTKQTGDLLVSVDNITA